MRHHNNNPLPVGAKFGTGFLRPRPDRAAKKSKLLLALGAGCLLNVAALATSTDNFTISVDASNPGCTIDPNFVGTTIGHEYIDGASGYSTKVFVATNSQLVNLYNEVGIKHIRVNFGQAGDAEPTTNQIDNFFDFCAAAGVNKVIWSFPLRLNYQETGWTYQDVAKHIWTTTTANGTVEKNFIDSFAFDNEPDGAGFMSVDPKITDYTSYVNAWTSSSAKISADCPGCVFSGPDSLCHDTESIDGWCDTSGQTPSGKPWVVAFGNSIGLVNANQHCYVAGPNDHGHDDDQAQYASLILNNDWDTNLFEAIDGTLHAPLNVPLRYTEALFLSDGESPTNHIFATGLAFLDFYHFQARHCVQGIDAMSNPFMCNAVIYKDASDNYDAEPMAYAQKAFWMGSYGGNVIYTSKFSTSPKNNALSAYGVVNGSHLYVTVINKSCTSAGNAFNAKVTINISGLTVHNYSATTMEQAPGASGASLYGADISGGTLNNDGSPFSPQAVTGTVSGDTFTATVIPATATIYDFH